MKKQNRIIVIFLIIGIVLSIYSNVWAYDLEESMEYTESYKQWLELPDDEKQNYIMPRMYEVPYTRAEYKNPLVKANMLGTSFKEKFSLKDLIPNNLIIKDQQKTGSCWAFAALSSLETNLALQDYFNNNTEKIYDFSERHMEYSTSREFKNSEINPLGYNRKVGAGGDWGLASSYLTNGSGAIDESQMPFENNEDLIELSQIQNKDVTSQIYDTIEFPDYNDSRMKPEESEDIKNQIKQHIQNYGAVFATVRSGSWARTVSGVSNTTGALQLGRRDT